MNHPGFVGDSKPDKDESNDKEQNGRSIFTEDTRVCEAGSDGVSGAWVAVIAILSAGWPDGVPGLPNGWLHRKTKVMQTDNAPPPVSDPPGHRARPGGVVLALMGLSVVLELVLVAADFGWIGSTRWRGLVYQNGAFWAGLLYDWRPNYAAQPWAMFLSYAFLHDGLGHLAGNMLTLAVLGPLVQARAGQGVFLAIYFLSAIGGAAGFALLSGSPQPVVGASGALFGLAGALLFRDWSGRRGAGRSPWPVACMILFLIALNVGMWWMLDGVLAWETHLAGFVTGWLVAAALSWGRRN